VANCDVLNTVPKALLTQRVGLLSAAKLRQLNAALRFALALD
jgi:mRNA-degrading endonuclease toxin of MazEF toxin-antitoxin module